MPGALGALPGGRRRYGNLSRRARSGTWTTLELETLRRLFPSRPVAAVARRLRRSETSVRARARRLFGPRRRRSPWTAEDDDRLRGSFGAIPAHDLAIVLGRSQREIQQRVQELRAQLAAQPWSAADERRLRRVFGSRDLTALEVALGRPAGDIEARAAMLQLGKDKRGAAGRGRAMPRWNPEDERRLRHMYGDHTNLAIARALGRSVASVTNKASQLGLVKAAAARSRAGRANVARRWNPAPGS